MYGIFVAWTAALKFSSQSLLNVLRAGCKSKSVVNAKVRSRLILLLSFSKFLSPLIGIAHKPSMPPRSIITIKFFLGPLLANVGAPNPAKYNDVNAVVFKKSLLFIFMLLKTPGD